MENTPTNTQANEQTLTEPAETHARRYAPPQFSRTALAWLNALPAYPDSTDLFTLNENNFALKVIRELFEKQAFELPIAANYPAAEWLNHFYFEAKNRERIFGSKTFGLGYPFVLAEAGGHQMAAPLFFWQLALEPHSQYVDNWTVQRGEGQSVVPNFPLFYLVDRLHGSDFTERARRATAGKQLKTSDLAEISTAICGTLGLQEQGLTLSVLPSPGASEIEVYTRQGVLHWSGVVGIFPSLPMTVTTEPPVVVPDLPADLVWKHSFSTMPMDPSQRAVLQSVQQNALTVVEGASGTGKTYTISNIIVNALSNGKKCLVVSHNIAALRRAQRFILEKGFGDLSFIVRDLAGDQLMLADMLRAAADNKAKEKFNEDVFKTALNRVQRETRKLDDAWEGLHSPVFGEQSFVETVGRFLRANRAEGKELLQSQLNPSDFQFTKAEFDETVAAIRASEPLFRKFPTFGHPLARLNGSIFLDNESGAGLALTERQVKNLLDKATALHHRYISKTNEYAEALTDHYEQHYAELAALTKRVTNQLEDGVNRFGPDFEKPASTTEKLYGVFSDKYKSMVAQKEKIGQDFGELRKTYATRKYFDFDFPASLDVRNIRKINELTKDFEAALRLWRKRIPANVREDVRRLNSKSNHFDLDFREQIKDLEYALDVFVGEFNEANLYADELRHEMLTIPKRQEFLEGVLVQLEDTQFYLRDFPDFHVWQRHWLGLSPVQQKAVRALGKIKPKNWAAAFESWYLHHLLQQEYSPNLVWDSETLENWSAGFRELREVLPGQISAIWQKRRAAALRQLKNEDSDGYKTWFGKNNRTLSAARRPEELFQKHIHALTETLPVLLVTPQVALDVVQSSAMLFDLILVDEGHNIMKQKAFHLFDMGKNIVLFGDSKQDMTPFAEDDILEFCKSIGAQTLTLDYQHQHCPEEWIDFNKIAFGTPFKRLPSNLSGHDVTTVANVEGRYDEATCTNEAEARQIIDWLNLIEPTPAKTYPVVGIACATVQQRDLIAGQLLKIRQRRAAGHEKIQQLHLSGMGVYQFGELQGQHVDVLLLSLTHGLTDAQGKLTKDLHFWNTQLGINQLHIALTRATQRIFIAHSIPPGLHTVLAADRNHRGTCILSHLVTFAEQIQGGQKEAAAGQLESMKNLLAYPEDFFPSNIFMEEVEIALQPYFEPGRIERNATVAGVTVPLVIHGSQPNVLLFDGVLAKTALPSYEWEEKLRQYFDRNGIAHIQTLSVQWWKSPKQEARKLAGRVISSERVEAAEEVEKLNEVEALNTEEKLNGTED